MSSDHLRALLRTGGKEKLLGEIQALQCKMLISLVHSAAKDNPNSQLNITLSASVKADVIEGFTKGKTVVRSNCRRCGA